MGSSFENMIDLIVAILFLFLFPILLINQHKDEVIHTVAGEKVNTFVEMVNIKGYISENMYGDLERFINEIDPSWKITLEHEKRQYYPTYENGSDEIFINIYTEEILKGIYENKDPYYLNNGDYLKVTLLGDNNNKVYKNAMIIRGGY